MSTLFYRIFLWIAKNKLLSGILLVVVLVLLGLTATQLKFEEDITKLIPTNSETEKVQKVLKSVNFTDKIIVNISRRPDASIEDLTQYADQLLDSINKNCSGYVKNIQGKINEDQAAATLDFVYDNLPLFLDEEDYQIIENKLHQDSISKLTLSNYKTLISPSGFVAKQMIRKDPLGLSFIALKKFKNIGPGNEFKLRNGYLLDEEEQHVLLFISPTYPANATDKNEGFVSELYTIQNQLNTSYEGKVESEYYGSALIAVANAQQIKDDIKFTVGIAMTVLLVILILFYKKLYIPLILFFPTLFGGLLSVAILYLIRDEISAISLGIGSVLLGITLDYSLHILTHIKSDPDPKDLYKQITAPILMSSLTTACAFLCLLFLNSQALQDLGIFASCSVMGASIFALIFIPQVYKVSASAPSKKDYPINKLVHYPFHQKKWAIGLFLLLLVVSAFTFDSVNFNNDISKLNYEPEAIQEAKVGLDSVTSISSKSLYLATYDSVQEKALQRSDRLYKYLQELQKEDKVEEIISLSSLVNSQKKQENKLALWNDFWNSEKINYTESNLVEEGREYGFKPDTYQEFFNLLNRDFRLLTLDDYEAFGIFTLDDYINRTEDFITTTTLVKLEESSAEELRDEFKDFPNTLLIDRQEMNETFLGHLKNDFNQLINYSLAVVFVLLLLFYRSLSLTIVTGLPIFVTGFITLGLMGLLEIEFNIFNIIISTFIFGLGVDYSIFVTNAMIHELRTGKSYLPTHKTSIVLSVLTTILGIGVMIFAKHPALYSISVVSVIGICSAVFVAFTIQPLLFNLLIGSSNKPPISLRLFLHSLISFSYFGFGSLILSFVGSLVLNFFPVKEKKKMSWFHRTTSTFFTSVLYSNPFVKKQVFNRNQKSFSKPSIIIANHTSFLDILSMFMTYHKLIFLVNDWVYNSPVFGKGVRAAGFYPVSEGIDNAFGHLREKVEKGYSLVIFPEGSRNKNHKIRRFHKGAFLLAEELQLPITPVLIHGNSEVLPKGSFVIRDGSISIKVLEQVPEPKPESKINARQLTKKVSTYFREEFYKFRREIEGPTYFHQFVKNEYRFKGNKLYNYINKDLKENAELYYKIILAVPQKTSVVHLSKEYGQLDFLLCLDSDERKITTLIPDKETCRIVNSSYLTQTRKNITAVEVFDKIKVEDVETLLINLGHFSISDLKSFFSEKLNYCICYGVNSAENNSEIESLGFKKIEEKENIIVFSKIG